MPQTPPPVITFGTDGIRGHADHFPFDQSTLIAFGNAIALWASHKYNVLQPQILLGMDTRISGPRIKEALCVGLRAGGAVVVDGGVLPTPAVCGLIHRDRTYHAGVVISASHNPYHDNGIKIFAADRIKLTPDDEVSLLGFMRGDVGKNPVGEQASFLWPAAGERYIGDILARFKPGFLQGVQLVIDAAHGATYHLAPMLLRALGATVIMLNDQPDGKNINADCGAVHPEKLVAAVLELKAHAGFAFDGDGDRIVAVGRDGSVKDGDDIVALLMQLPMYASCPVVVGTVMSNQGFAAHVAAQGKQFIRAAVGDKYVVAGMEQQQALIGGEVSGHVIARDYLASSDGIFAALRVLESVMLHDNWNMVTFEKYPQALVSVRVAVKKDLQTDPFVSMIAACQERLGSGRLLVRYSGTEPVLRVMVEAATQGIADTTAQVLAHELKIVLDQ